MELKKDENWLPLKPTNHEQETAEKIRILAATIEEVAGWLFDLATSLDGFKRADVNFFGKKVEEEECQKKKLKKTS